MRVTFSERPCLRLASCMNRHMEVLLGLGCSHSLRGVALTSIATVIQSFVRSCNGSRVESRGAGKEVKKEGHQPPTRHAGGGGPPQVVDGSVTHSLGICK